MGSSDKLESLKLRVQYNPYDAIGWEQLLGEISRGRKTPEQTAQLREVYEDLLSKFPTSAAYWKEYCELEIDNGTPEAVKTLFSRCLLTCLDVDLWRSYLRFIRRLNDPRGAEGLGEVRQALEFALDHIGQDVRSGPVWQEYIAFMSAPKVGSPEHAAIFGNAPEGQEDAQRTAGLRRAYHRALMVPNAALDALWTGYERFENTTGNRTLAKRTLDEWRPKYHASRTLVKDRTALADRLDLRALPLPPGRAGARQIRQAAAWREYIAWERANHQELDGEAYQARVILAYEQALGTLLQYPDVWLDFASWHTSGGGAGPASGTAVLHRARRALPSALVLHFAAADSEEAAGAVDSARSVYEGLVETLLAEAVKAENVGAGGVEAEQKPTSPSPPAAPAGGGGEEASAGAGGVPEETTTTQDADGVKVEGGGTPAAGTAAGTKPAEPPSKPPSTPALPAPQFSPSAGTLIWVQFMRFARRAEGIMAARKLFLRARKWAPLGWEAFVASAQLEWAQEGKDQIPRNIFELGLKTFISEPGYVLQYSTFLQGLGDVTNARALFERALAVISPPLAIAVWDAYLGLEADVGTLASAAAVEARRLEATTTATAAGGGGSVGQHDPLDAVRVALLKYRFLDLLPGPEACFRGLEVGGGEIARQLADRDADIERVRGRDRERERERDGERERGTRDRDRDVRRDVDPREDPRRRGGGGSGDLQSGGVGGGESTSRGRRRSRSRSPSRRGPDPNEPIRHFPRELGLLLNQLSLAPDGPVPDVQQVIDILLRADFSLEGIEAHEAAAARERRRQRQIQLTGRGHGAPGEGGQAGQGSAPGGGGFPLKRKPEAVLEDSDGGTSEEDGDEDGGGLDVYRRRMRARV